MRRRNVQIVQLPSQGPTDARQDRPHVRSARLVGGPDKVTIVLVVHGSALKAFHTESATASIVQRTSEFSKSGLELDACSNSMRSQNVTLKDLVPGFVAADRGAVVRIAELQSQGYVYLRP